MNDLLRLSAKWALAALVAATVAACGPGPNAAEESFGEVFDVGDALVVDVRNDEGATCIRVGDVDRAVVTGRVVATGFDVAQISARAKAIAQQPPLELVDGKLLVGHAGFALDGRDSVVIDYRIEVPAFTKVITSNVSGHTCVEGIDGEVRADSVSGGLELSHLGGRVVASTVSGDLRLDGAASARVETISGDLRIRNVSGDFALVTTSGDVDAGDLGASADISTVSGDVAIVSALATGATWKLESTSGELAMTLAADESFSVDFETTSGHLRVDHPMSRRSRADDSLTGDVGERPDASIIAKSVSGDIRVVEPLARDSFESP